MSGLLFMLLIVADRRKVENTAMKQWAQSLMQVGAAACLLGGLGWMAAQHWLGSADFKRWVEGRAGLAVGTPVSLGRVTLDVWPIPAVALLAVRLETQPVATIERVEVRVRLRALLAGRVEFSRLRVVGADVSQAGLADLLAQRRNKATGHGDGGTGSGAAGFPGHVLLENLTWRPLKGPPTALDAEVRIGPENLPDALSLALLAGQFQGAKLRLARRQLVWDVLVEYAGGSIKGNLALDRLPAPGVAMSLRGALRVEGVEVGVLSRQRLTGHLSADTTLSLTTGQPGDMFDALQTQGRFNVRAAVVHGVDLVRAVKTVGLSRGGVTRLDTLSGQVDTRGASVNFRQLVASSGLLSASGQVALSPTQALSGRVQVSLGPASIGRAVGVPLVLGGTLDAPELTLTRSAMLGAAVGTMVMPGVGTGAGASIGDKIGNKLQGFFGK
jgi:hypothetical protein